MTRPDCITVEKPIAAGVTFLSTLADYLVGAAQAVGDMEQRVEAHKARW
jgi:hypothetical protein